MTNIEKMRELQREGNRLAGLNYTGEPSQMSNYLTAAYRLKSDIENGYVLPDAQYIGKY